MNRWITKKIADIADVVAGGTPSTNNSEFWNGNIGWIKTVFFPLHPL